MENIKLFDLALEPKEPKVVTLNVLNGESIEIEIRKMSTQERINLVQDIVNSCVLGDNNYFYNPYKLTIITKVKLIKAITNIEITDEDIENDIYKVYDALENMGMFEYNILDDLGFHDVFYDAENCVIAIYKFRSSFRGFLQEMQDGRKLEEMNGELTDIIDNFKNSPEIMELLQIATANVTNS